MQDDTSAPYFLIIATGDGDQQILARGYADAAKQALASLTTETRDELASDDYCRIIHDIIADPDHEEWADAGDCGNIGWNFEDGHLTVIRISPSALNEAGCVVVPRELTDEKLLESSLWHMVHIAGDQCWSTEKNLKECREIYADLIAPPTTLTAAQGDGTDG